MSAVRLVAHQFRYDMRSFRRNRQALVTTLLLPILLLILFVSAGGKDSTWQVLKCLELGLKPLAVTWRPPGRTKIGQENLDNLIRLGVDHVDYSINPNVEKIIELHPDLVISYGSQDVLSERLQSLGVQVFPFRHGNVEQTLRFILDLGRRVGTEDRAEQLVAGIRHSFDEVRAVATANRPKVFLVHDRAGGTLGSFYTIGSRAFQHDLIEIAGGLNVFGEVDVETFQPSLEEVLRRKPDIILETLSPPADPQEVEQRKRDWGRLGLPRERIYIEEETYLLVPGPRFGLAAHRISEIVRGVR